MPKNSSEASLDMRRKVRNCNMSANQNVENLLQMYWNGIFQRKRALQGIIFHFPEEARHSIARAHVHSTNWTHWTLYTAHCTLYNAHCTLYTAQWTLNTVHFSLYTVHFSLYTVHWTTGHYTYNNVHFHFFSVFPESASDAQLTCLWRQTTRVLFFVFVFLGLATLWNSDGFAGIDN